MHTHFDGIKIMYTSDGKGRGIYFWAKGFGQHLNIAEMRKLIRAIQKFQKFNKALGQSPREREFAQPARTTNTRNHPTLENIPVDLMNYDDVIEHRNKFVEEKATRNDIKLIDKVFYGSIGFFIGFILTILSIFLAATVGISAGVF
jgi:hypothetical protein